MAVDIENQGRHDGQGFSELARDLWDNKPLLIVFAVGLFLLIYALAKNSKGSLTAQQPLQNPAGSNGTYLIVNDNQPPPVNVTVNAPEPTSGSGGSTPPVSTPPPVVSPVRGGPIVPPIKPVPPPTQNKPRTVTVLPWPSQDSTLWGIAQHYGYGTNWQVIYNANKSKIGSDPNLIHPGLVLTLP